MAQKDIELIKTPHKRESYTDEDIRQFALCADPINGPKYFLNQTGLLNKLNKYDLGIFCEGKFDESSLEGKIIGELLSVFKGTSYFLGGQYKAKENFFKNTFECGIEGLNQPKQSLSKATKELIKILQMD